jgi:hypothetical protein
VKEIFEEEFSPQAERLREELIARISVKEDNREKEREEISFKAILMESLRILASACSGLEDSMRKTSDNCLILESRKLSFGRSSKDGSSRWSRERRTSDLRDRIHRSGERPE